jgi:hypothetical protein
MSTGALLLLHLGRVALPGMAVLEGPNGVE